MAPSSRRLIFNAGNVQYSTMATGNEGGHWLNGKIDGFLLDVYGVLYDTGSRDVAIDGSVEAIAK